MIYSNAYKIYIDEELLPITPAAVNITNQNKNEEFMLANGRPFTVARYDGAKKFSFEFEVTLRTDYSFVFPGANCNPEFWKTHLEDIKEKRDPIYLVIERKSSTSTYCVLLDDYSYDEDNDNANDYIFSVSFTEYHPQNNQELDTEVEHHLITAKEARGWVGQQDTKQLEEEARLAQEQEAAEERQDKRIEARINDAMFHRREQEENEQGGS